MPTEVLAPVEPFLLANAVANEVRPGERVLDVGTGSGINAIVAAKTSARVLAVDPFRWFTPRDVIETAIADENYSSLTQFIRTARDYLSDRGRVLIHFGTSADVAYLDELIESERFWKEEVSRCELRGDWAVSYFVLRLVSLKDDG